MHNDNTCVCCGAPIPEGRQVCHACEKGDTHGQNTSQRPYR